MTCKKCKYEFCWVCMGTYDIQLEAYCVLKSYRTLVGARDCLVLLQSVR